MLGYFTIFLRTKAYFPAKRLGLLVPIGMIYRHTWTYERLVCLQTLALVVPGIHDSQSESTTRRVETGFHIPNASKLVPRQDALGSGMTGRPQMEPNCHWSSLDLHLCVIARHKVPRRSLSYVEVKIAALRSQ